MTHSDSSSPVEMAPGSPEARRNGCKCSPAANRDGQGIATVGSTIRYAISLACPMHGDPESTLAPRCPETGDLFT